MEIEGVGSAEVEITVLPGSGRSFSLRRLFGVFGAVPVGGTHGGQSPSELGTLECGTEAAKGRAGSASQAGCVQTTVNRSSTASVVGE